MRNQHGFTLLELMLAVGILVIMSTVSVGYYAGVFRSISLESMKKIAIVDLRTAQANAIQGEYAMKWGVHFVNGATQYYEIFRTPTNYADGARVTTVTTSLAAGVAFTDPVSSSAKDIIFDRTTGLSAATSVAVQNTSSGEIITISVTADGIIQ